MIIAGFDVAQKTGVAILDGSKIQTMTIAYKERSKTDRTLDRLRDVFRGHGSDIDSVRAGDIGSNFALRVRSVLLAYGVEAVAIEEPLIKGDKTTNKAIFSCCGLAYTVASVCTSLHIPNVMVHQAKWRKAFLGNGAASGAKDRAVQQCKFMRIPISSTDSAEAVGIAWWARGVIDPYSHKLPNEFDLFPVPPSGGIAATASA